jgi:hypothetical protein
MASGQKSKKTMQMRKMVSLVNTRFLFACARARFYPLVILMYSFSDASKPEGTLKLMIKNFHNMNDTVRGPGVVINGVPW